MARAHKKFQHGQHSEIYLLTLKEQDKTKMELSPDMVSKHAFWYPYLPDYVESYSFLPGSRAILDLSYRSRLRWMSQQFRPTMSMAERQPHHKKTCRKLWIQFLYFFAPVSSRILEIVIEKL